MKICVYAISKNESKFVDRFMDSTKGADAVYVLDTGSTDDTVLKLQKRNAIVKTKKFDFFRFDEARNESLNMVPKDVDVCICLDLDEVLCDNFRQIIEQEFTSDVTRLRYNYIWSHDNKGNPKVNFYADKIHRRKNYKWTHPVHEVLTCTSDEVFKTVDSLTINHFPDDTKSRSSYLPLLELAVKEDPTDDRNMHYLGREYMYYGKYNECIDTLIKHLKLEKSTWKPERCASMRFISRSYQALLRYDEAFMWLEKAIIECPNIREPYVEMALLCYKLNKWDKVIENCKDALKIEKNEKVYINEPFCYDETIFDLLSIAYYNLEQYDKAYDNVLKALLINPDNERIKNNKIIIENKIK